MTDPVKSAAERLAEVLAHKEEITRRMVTEQGLAPFPVSEPVSEPDETPKP